MLGGRVAMQGDRVAEAAALVWQVEPSLPEAWKRPGCQPRPDLTRTRAGHSSGQQRTGQGAKVRPKGRRGPIFSCWTQAGGWRSHAFGRSSVLGDPFHGERF